MNVEPTGANATVTGAIRQAARATGVDFKYLLATAQVESKLNPRAQAQTSSARGLFQFIDQTWLTALKEQGAALGYGPYADAIQRQPSGQYVVANPRLYDRIMNLRSDPNASALMAGAFTQSNAARLAERLGRSATEGELYIAHFMGSAGAGRLIDLAASRPYTPAAPLFPTAARANPSIFFDKRGHARGAGEVYRALVGRYQTARASQNVPPSMVTASTAAKTQAAQSMRGASAPDTASVSQAYAAAGGMSQPRTPAGDTGPVFHGLFRSTGRPEPVAPVVSALWGTSPAPAQPEASTARPVPRVLDEPAPPAPSGEPLDLFQDHLPDARALFRGRV